MSHDEESSNNSGNLSFDHILNQYLTRRKALKGGLAGAAVSMAGFSTMALAKEDKRIDSKGHRKRSRLIDFEQVPLDMGNGPIPAISNDYEYQVLIPWGEPLQPSGPVYQYPPNSTDQAQQIGIGHDGMWFFPTEQR